jgi:hypothetical protein
VAGAVEAQRAQIEICATKKKFKALELRVQEPFFMPSSASAD